MARLRGLKGARAALPRARHCAPSRSRVTSRPPTSRSRYRSGRWPRELPQLAPAFWQLRANLCGPRRLHSPAAARGRPGAPLKMGPKTKIKCKFRRLVPLRAQHEHAKLHRARLSRQPCATRCSWFMPRSMERIAATFTQDWSPSHPHARTLPRTHRRAVGRRLGAGHATLRRGQHRWVTLNAAHSPAPLPPTNTAEREKPSSSLSACSFTACLLRDAGQVMTQAADDKSVQMLVLGSFGRKEKGASAGCATCHGTRRALPARSVSERQALVPGKVQGVWPMARMRARL